MGLPLALAFAKHNKVIGYDVNSQRIAQLSQGIDSNSEFSSEDLRNDNLAFCNRVDALAKANIYIVTVPTPVYADHKPDLTHLIAASEMVGSYLQPGDMVVYESTVYPGVTEDECLPILESRSSLKVNQDFGLGYSPERINPGDKERTLATIVKITSGSNQHWAKRIDDTYKKIITAGTWKAESIKVAEAAKVIENTQRDLNIALVNQLAQLFNILGIDTKAVLEAAATKWNFLPFKPGLVGGHCIGVDPYYLCHKAETVGYIPDIILAGRRLNDSMAVFVAQQIIKSMCKARIALHDAQILVLGITFKENCNDSRNTKVVDLIKELENFSCRVSIYDPLADNKEIKHKFDLDLVEYPTNGKFDAVVLAVPHDELLAKMDEFADKLTTNGIIYDLKGILPQKYEAKRL